MVNIYYPLALEGPLRCSARCWNSSSPNGCGTIGPQPAGKLR